MCAQSQMCRERDSCVVYLSTVRSMLRIRLMRTVCAQIFLSSLFLLWFGFLKGPHQLPGAISSLRSDAEPEDELEASRMLFPAAIPTSLLSESCDGDVEDETLPEPGTTRSTKIVRVADNTLPIFDQSWLLTADPHM